MVEQSTLNVFVDRHNGIDIFTGTMQYKPAPSSTDRLRSRVDPVTNINFKVVNHIDGRPAIRHLTAETDP